MLPIAQLTDGSAVATARSSVGSGSNGVEMISPIDNVSVHGGGNGRSTSPVRPTRKQVSRACDWCRARRIKCDNGRPCKACRARDVECTHRGGDEPRTLPQALREINRLKSRVRELETELARARSGSFKPGSIPSPEQSSSDGTSPGLSQTSASSSTTLSTHTVPLHYSQQQHVGGAKVQTPSALSEDKTPQWEGIYVATARSDQTSYYGPSSAFYFVSRIGTFLNRALQQPCADRQMQPKGASRNVSLGENPQEGEGEGEGERGEDGTSMTKAAGGHDGTPSMNRTQEEYFLSLFWESYHCFQPVVDETELRRHYASLWEPAGRTHRRMSPLVDIILALCLQYGYTFIPRDSASKRSGKRDASHDDATIAGRWYYRRSQALLTADLESPSITTLQCYIFTTNYLCCASFTNMCHVVCAQGIRVAQILGMHLEPPADLPNGERELRKRIWWGLWLLDNRIGTKLGRPFLIDPTQTTVTLPSDDIETATYNGATLGYHSPDVTWLTYFLQMQRLMGTVMDIHKALYSKAGEVIAAKGLSNLYKDPRAMETCAEFLAARLPAMRDFVDQLPPGMKTRRRGGGEPFSNDRSALEIDTMAPTWLQLHRVCIELHYLAMMTNLTRPFITFYSNSSTYTPTAERHAASCVSYAVAHTHIMHQLVMETDLMGGWTEFFLWQWNSAITIAGFILAYPIHPSTPGARRALDKAIQIFDRYGADFAVSASAAIIARDLVAKADLLTSRLRNEITLGSSNSNNNANNNNVAEPSPAAATTAGTPAATGAVGNLLVGPGGSSIMPPPNSEVCGPNGGISNTGVDGPPNVVAEDTLAWLDPSQQDDPGNFGEFMDWAVSVDSFNNFDRFFDASNPADPWLLATQLQPHP